MLPIIGSFDLPVGNRQHKAVVTTWQRNFFAGFCAPYVKGDVLVWMKSQAELFVLFDLMGIPQRVTENNAIPEIMLAQTEQIYL